MRLGITLKNETKSVFGERPEHVTSIILPGLLQVPASFPRNAVWTELIHFSSKSTSLFSGSSWGVWMFLGKRWASLLGTGQK